MSRVFDRDPREMSEAEFLRTFGAVYENSPQFASDLRRRGSLPREVDRFAEALAAIVDAAGRHERLALIRAHPDLAGRAAIAGALTDASRGEQASAGLDRCTPEEYARFETLNTRYRERFGFPFIMAVKGADRHRILDAFAERIDNDPDTEFARAMQEIHKIARLRLEEIAGNG